ncbi:MAG: hypothetical protein R3C99_18950 [Pirellulaceae bacterium]
METCFACRQRLHQAAGDRDSWEDARLLRDEPFDAEPLSGWSESAESDDVAGDVDSDWATQHAAVASDGTQRVLDGWPRPTIRACSVGSAATKFWASSERAAWASC